MKRIELIAPPMSGHLHPVLGLAVRLAAESDYSVRVLSTTAAQSDIAASGVRGVEILPRADATIRAITRPDRRVGANPRRLLAQFRATLGLLNAFHLALLDRWERGAPDLVIADYTLPVAGVAAARVGTRWWTAHPSPCVIEAGDGPPAYLGGWRPGETAWGRARDATGRAVVSAFKRTAFRFNRGALAPLGYAGAYRADGTEAAYSAERVLALAPAGLDFPRRLPPSVAVVGPVLFTPPRDLAPAPLRPGRQTVLITAGTELPRQAGRLVQDAARLAGRRADLDIHVSLGGTPSTEGDGRRGANLVVLPWVDYARDLPRYDVVVHHGGAGVLAHTLAAGLPAVVCPVDYDQFDHAARLAAAGVALWRRPGADLLPLVEVALASAQMRTAAQHFAAQMEAHPAPDAVADLIRAAWDDPLRA